MGPTRTSRARWRADRSSQGEGRKGVGDRVLTSDPSAKTTEVDAATWRKIVLRMPNPQQLADIIELELLRSVEWMEAVQCAAGAVIWFDLEEMGLHGWAEVVRVEPCPPIKAGPGRVVLATVTHDNSFLMDLRLAGIAEPLHLTDRHRLFSATRHVSDHFLTIDLSLCLCSHDPACGSGGMFVQSEKYVESHGGKPRFSSDNPVNFSLN